MKKVSGFYLAKHKKPKDLVKQMQLIEMDSERKKLNKLRAERKAKLKQNMVHEELKLPHFSPLKKSYFEFSSVPPITSNEPFITQKQKRKLASSDRAYSSTPNLKVEKINSVFQERSDADDPVVVNRMFIEFDRLIDRQRPELKIKALQQIRQNEKLPRWNSGVEEKKSYFHPISTDRYNFYKTNDYQSIGSTTTSCGYKTDRLNQSQISNQHLQSSLLLQAQTSRLKRSLLDPFSKQKTFQNTSSTLQPPLHENRSTMDCSVLNKSRFKHHNRESKESFGDESVSATTFAVGVNKFSKSRIRSHNHSNNRMKLTRIVFQQKDLNSIQ